MSETRPPRSLRWLARVFIRGSDGEFVLGDLEELYRDEAAANGTARASAAYTVWVLRSGLRGMRSGAAAGLAGDLRLALRQFRKNPRVYVNSTIVLSVGMGVAAFSWGIYYGSYLRGLPVDDADRIVEISMLDAETREPLAGFSLHDVSRMATSVPALERIGLWRGEEVHLNDGGGPPLRTGTLYVTPSIFELLEFPPLVGRTFSETDVVAGAEAVAVLGYELWKERYDASPDIVGTTVRVNGRPHVVVGVLREGAGFLGLEPLWLPFRDDDASVTRANTILARRSSGTHPKTLAARLSGFALAQASSGDPAWDAAALTVNRVGDSLRGPNASTTLRIMLTSGLLLLVMALANVANLFLVRSQVRARELAVRRALGAGRFRILRQLALEAAVPATVGFAGATLVAGYALDWYERAAFIYGGHGPSWVHYGLEWPHMAGLAVATVLCTVVVAVLAGLREFRRGDAGVLRSGRGISGTTFRMGRSLLAVQIAVGGTLLLLASILLRSGWNLRTVDWGFETETVLTGEVVLEGDAYDTDDERARFFSALERELHSIPGVNSATLATLLPMIRYRGSHSIEVEGWEFSEPRELPRHYADFVTPTFFETFGKPLVSGREFDASDVADSEPVAIVNTDFSRKFFSGESPLGRRVRIWRDDTPGPWRTVVGLAPHLWMDTDVDAHPEGIYVPLSQASPTWTQFAIRVGADPTAFAPRLRQAVARLDSELPVIDVRSMPQLIRARTRLYRFQSPPLIAVGIAALILSIVGLYAVVSYLASLRTAEFGVRAALGAGRGELMRRAAASALIPTAAGVLGGLVGGLALIRGFDRMVFLSDPWNPEVVAASFGVLVVSSLASSLLPAIRSARVDLVKVLSSD